MNTCTWLHCLISDGNIMCTACFLVCWMHACLNSGGRAQGALPLSSWANCHPADRSWTGSIQLLQSPDGWQQELDPSGIQAVLAAQGWAARRHFCIPELLTWLPVSSVLCLQVTMQQPPSTAPPGVCVGSHACSLAAGGALQGAYSSSCSQAPAEHACC